MDDLQNVNYPGLRALYEKYNSLGFNLVAFPCNQVRLSCLEAWESFVFVHFPCVQDSQQRTVFCSLVDRHLAVLTRSGSTPTASSASSSP